MSKHEVSKPYFPGFTRKSVTFTIDDGNLEMDRKFISIVAPYGIKGTFNLCGNRIIEGNREEILELYRGFEIANHCAWHPFCFGEEVAERITDEPFSEATADPDKVYHNPRVPHLYYVHTAKGWRKGTFAKEYLLFAKEGQEQLEEVFGEGNVHGFVWPFGKQKSVECYEGLVAMGFPHMRITGNVLDTTGYAIPADFLNWSYNANNKAIRAQVPIYEAYPDDGELKFFSIGVHSIDFERDNNFCDLEYFARTFGNKPELYYTAGVDEIFRYSVAAKSLIVTDAYVENPSDMDIYIKVDGEKFIVRAHTKLDLETKILVF
ncbi:MAG: polysaccharide deacetylase family protein [Clostridia bacterium]|nr:polysaccharide deacetylase family protein [Clostridia bacterium]